MVQDSRQAGAEIEVTREMIEAGAKVLIDCGYFDGLDSMAELVAAQICQAAISAGNGLVS